EELGLYGSRYFADDPTGPLASIAAQLNVDMIGRNHDNNEAESNTVYTVGADRISSELHNSIIDAIERVPRPMALNVHLHGRTHRERIYDRSDHYSHASNGTPVIVFTTFLHPDYHRVTDSSDKINFDKMAHITQFIYETGRRVAGLDPLPVRDFKGPRVGK